MKAAILKRFGPPSNIEVREVPTPQVKPDQVLVRIRATCVNSGDARVRGKNVPKGYGFLMGLFFGFSKPRQPILGTALAGEIMEIGAEITRFKVGDRVFGDAGLGMGAHAEMIALKQDAGLVKMPDDLSFEHAATLPFGGSTAKFFLVDRAGLKTGERLLINGASGTVGVQMVQLAKYMGAHVTGVSSSANHALLRDLGADEVIDYRTTDIGEMAEQFDVIADCIGNVPFKRMRKRLKSGGRFLMVVGTLFEGLAAPFQSMFGVHKVMGGTANSTQEDLNWLLRAREAGYLKPVIDTTYPLSQIVAAHTRVDTGRKTGSVVISMPAD